MNQEVDFEKNIKQSLKSGRHTDFHHMHSSIVIYTNQRKISSNIHIKIPSAGQMTHILRIIFETHCDQFMPVVIVPAH